MISSKCEIVASIVSPSDAITEDYAQTILVTIEGQVVKGRVEQETDDSILIRGVDAQARPVRIPKTDIEQRSLSKVSMMPTGTINHLNLEQVLDLLAYLLSDGDEKHAAYQR